MAIALVTFLIEGLICSLTVSHFATGNIYVAITVIIVNAIAMIIGILRSKLSKEVTVFLLLGFALRLFLLFFDLYCKDIFVLPNSGQDTERFARQAEQLYLTGEDTSRGFLYVHFIATIYRFFGANRPVAQYLNLLMGMCIIFIAINILEKLKVNRRAQTYAIMLISLLPNLAITHVLLLRESVIMFMLSVSLYFLMKWIYGESFMFLIISAACAIIAALFHSGAIAVLLGEAITFIIYDRKNQKINLRPASIASLVVVILAFAVIYTQFGDALFGKFERVESTEDILETADIYTKGGSSYEAGFKIANPTLNLIINTPIRMFYFVASPLPWSWRGIQDVIAFVFSALVYLFIYYRAFTELKNNPGNKYRSLIVILLMIMLSSALVFAWGVSNSGTAMRHREKFIIFYIIMFAICESETKKPIKEIRIE